MSTFPDMVEVPRTLDDALDPVWLSAALGVRFPGVRVTDVTRGPVISRVSTNARFHIECADGAPEGLARDLCVKGYFTEIGWSFRHAGEPEATFYRDLAQPTGMRTLRCLYADVERETHHGVVISEDVVPQGATFLDALSPYSVDQAAESLGELATLHAATWMRSDLASAAWLTSRLTSYTKNRGLADIQQNFDGPIGAGVPTRARDAARLYTAYEALAARIDSASPWSVIHGDAHPGNLFLDGHGRPSFVDWQLVQRGPWFLDVGYHIASSLTVEDRRNHEDELLAHYLDRLAAGGVESLSKDEAKRSIRHGILHGFYLWGITLKVDPAITTALLERLGTAAADHDVLGLD